MSRKWFATAEDYRKLIEGKDIAIIGAGKHIAEQAYYYDLVVNISVDIHKRCDILYYQCAHDFGLITHKLKDIKFIHTALFFDNSQQVARWCEAEGVPYSFYVWPKNVPPPDWAPNVNWSCHADMDITPIPETIALSGFRALWHILQFNPRRVFVTGMDLYWLQQEHWGTHNLYVHYIWLRRALDDYPCLEIDTHFERAIKDFEQTPDGVRIMQWCGFNAYEGGAKDGPRQITSFSESENAGRNALVSTEDNRPA